MRAMEEEHGSKQGGSSQSLLARVVALEQEKREAVLRAELERAARQAERRIERLEQARALDAAKAEQARITDALPLCLWLVWCSGRRCPPLHLAPLSQLLLRLSLLACR